MSDLHLMVDADTIIVRAAMSAQTNFVVYADGVEVAPTKSRLQWTKDNPDLDPDKFEFRREERLKPDSTRPVSELAKFSIKKTIKFIQRKYPDRKLWICLEGEGNYRDDLYPAYKGQREGKILLRKELSAWVAENYPRVVIAEGCETDDRCAQYMWQGYQDFKKTGVYTYMVASCDKDLRTVAGLLYNYCNDEEVEIDELEADRWFGTQLLMGDSIDNIKGINGVLSKEFMQERGVKHNAKGVGQATAKNLLKNANSSSEVFQTVVDCYKDVHGKNWLYALREEGLALRMQHVKDERYDIAKHLKHLGVEL